MNAPPSEPNRSRQRANVCGILLALAGIVLLVLPLGSSTHSPPGHDAAHVMAFWIPGLLLAALGVLLNRTLLRLRTAVVLAAALAVIWLMTSVRHNQG